MKRIVFAIAVLGLSSGFAQTVAAKEKFLIQPVQVGNETVRYDQGVATVELFNRQGSVQIQPMPVDHGSLAFFVGVYNAGQLPANIDISNFSIQAGEQSLAVFSMHELEKKAKNRAMWTQIGIAALGGLAAAGAASQRDTYHSSFYTPRGAYHGYYSVNRRANGTPYRRAKGTPLRDGARLIGHAPLRCARRREGGARPEARAAQSIF